MITIRSLLLVCMLSLVACGSMNDVTSGSNSGPIAGSSSSTSSPSSSGSPGEPTGQINGASGDGSGGAAEGGVTGFSSDAGTAGEAGAQDLTEQPPPEWRAVQNGWYWDSGGYFFQVGDTVTGYTRHRGYARLKLAMSANSDGTLGIEAVPVGKWQDASALSIRVDGSLFETVQFDITSPNTRQRRVVSLPRGEHTVEIEEGSLEPGYGGCFVTALQFYGSVVMPTPPKRRLIEDGDSIGEGSLASPRSASWIMLERHGGRFDGVTVLGISGASAHDLTTTPAEQAKWADKIALAADGTEENVVVVELGANDYALESAADFAKAMSGGVDAIHAKIPNAKIALVGLGALHEHDNFDPPSSYNAALAAVATQRSSYCKYIDISSAYTAAQLADSVIHPDNSGHAAIFRIVDDAL